MKKGGRPRLLNTEKKKYKLPPVRLGTVDYVTVKNRSKQAGLTLTEYQRQMVLHGQIVERMTAEQMELYRQLAGMGNNMNDYLEACGIPLRYVGNGFGNFVDSDKPVITLMTYHSSKGLDFDKVFLPFCNHNTKEDQKADNDKQVFMVGMTRSRGDLIISFSKKLNRFVSKFADNCTHKDLATDGTPMLFDTPAKPLHKGRKVTTAELFGW